MESGTAKAMDSFVDSAVISPSRQVDLCGHILNCSPGEAADALAEALVARVDPLDYFARSLGMGDDLVIQRAAQWAGLEFAASVPQTIRGSASLMRLDSLATVRSLHASVDGEDRYYFSPRFSEIVALRQRGERQGPLQHRILITPRRALRAALAEANVPVLVTDARQRLARRWPRASASLDLSRALRTGFVACLALMVGSVAVAPLLARELLLPFLLVVIVAPALLRLVATFHRPATTDDDPLLAAANLPAYTILVPLRDEASMVPQLAGALRAIDYPPEKLEIIFLVESRSPETVAAVEAELVDPRFELLVIPDARPHTKPKALDYALPLVRGEHVVVYDAEDIPDRDQLRSAASRFLARPGIDCLQAELRVDNGAENWLTALFAGEYAGLFGHLLPFLAEMNLPLPLGGTSNHFRTSVLRDLGGWDAFNVTEDADLGVRLARLKLRTGTLRSGTAEEAPIRLGAWMRQRTRWVKGWMQTFLVHNRHPLQFLDEIGWRGFLFFQIYVGSLIASSLIHTVFVTTLVVQLLLFGPGMPRLADPWDWIYLLVLVIGYGGAFSIAFAGLVRQNKLDLAVYQLLLPIYWLLHAIAAVRAAVELLVRPYHWSKTAHGETRMVRVLRQR